MWRVGYFAGKASALFIDHNVFNAIERNVPMRLSSGAGIGYLNSCISSTCVNLLRNMINWKKWQSYIQETIFNVIETCTAFLATQGSNDSYILPYAIAAFNVMGGSEDMLRIGARARVAGSNGIGRVVGYYRGNSVALVAFRDSVTSVPQAVRADNLSPLDDALPKEGKFSLVKGGILTKAFLQILGSRVNEHLGKRRSSFISDENIYEGMPYSCMLARLQTSVVRALSIILRHNKSAVIARESGLLAQMFQVALQPLRLSAFVSATELSGRLQLLEEWSCEINGENGEKMIVDIPLDEDAFSSDNINVMIPRSVSKTLVDKRVRMDMAIKLWYLKSNIHGTPHPFRLCDRALETTARNGEMSINRASAWLETHEATEVLQAMRFEESDDSHSTTRVGKVRLR